MGFRLNDSTGGFGHHYHDMTMKANTRHYGRALSARYQQDTASLLLLVQHSLRRMSVLCTPDLQGSLSGSNWIAFAAPLAMFDLILLGCNPFSLCAMRRRGSLVVVFQDGTACAASSFQNGADPSARTASPERVTITACSFEEQLAVCWRPPGTQQTDVHVDIYRSQVACQLCLCISTNCHYHMRRALSQMAGASTIRGHHHSLQIWTVVDAAY